MKRSILTLAALAVSFALSASSVTYTVDSETIFPNPERGFITMLDHQLSQTNPHCVVGEESTLDSHMSKDKISIVLVHYYLDNYRSTSTIPNKVLQGFDEDMQVLRSKGLKAIVRFSYTSSTYTNKGKQSAKDAPLNIVKSHIEQYKSHWQANSDVIFVFQAGIVGAWGEWYYTDNFGNQESEMNSSRREVVDALLEAVPADRMIQLRTPLFKTGYIGDTQPLTADEAFSGSPRARLGQHNDAFLYDYDNMGTYADTATQKPWLAQETLYVPIGGETDITDVSLAENWATYEKTTAEMSRLHWTFIQSGYATQTTDMWRDNGTFDELNRKMGYRLHLIDATLPDEATAGSTTNIALRICNSGYAPMYNERHAYIVLKNGNTSYSVRLQSDPRRWLPNGVVTSINEQITLPENIAEGTYDLYLHLPDAYESLANDARYAVRFANTDVWDAATGMNSLNASVVIKSKQVVPDPGPEPGSAIVMPATLSKANVSVYSEDMTWFNTDYFDFGPEDAPNTERWAEWNVELRYPGKYIVSEVGFCENGHSYLLQLLDEGNELSSFTALDTDHWGEGHQSYTQPVKWDLSSVAQGVYTLRVANSTQWGRPKLYSLTLEYDGALPTATVQNHINSTDGSRYDVLGRKVDSNYKGIVISNGRKYLQQ